MADCPAMDQPRRRLDAVDLTEAIRELVSPREHRQSYRAGWRHPNRTGPVIRDHTTQQPSLLDQLRACITDRPASALGNRAGKIVYTNLPRFSSDAYDRLEAIKTAATTWCTKLAIPSEGTRRATLIARYCDHIQKIITDSGTATYRATAALDILRNTAATIRTAVDIDLRSILNNAASFDPTTIDQLARDADHWRTWCRIIAGWETPALQPHVPCPHCGTIAGERAGLRIRIDGASGTGGVVDDAGVRAAVCLTCNQTWDADTVGLLAEQLRQAGQELDGAA